ncbi:MAG: YggS family pyridoxal phosphate-dependent enzyme [Myxococcales bacterium]
MAGVAGALAAVRARVAAALAEAGRPPDAARLIAVSKQKPAALLREAYAAGQRDFGESYAQELRDKARELADLPEVRWHFVGRLQENKAKYVAPVATLVHAVGDVGLARELARRGGGRTIRCLAQINLAHEPQKSGVAPEEALALCRELAATPGVALQGLMCIPPDGPPARPFFRALRELRDELAEELARPLPELSMGMSHDFEDALREGATLMRVGTLIFGERE